MSAEQFVQPVSFPPHPPGLPPAEGWPVHPAMVASSSAIAGYKITRSLGVVRGLRGAALGATALGPSFTMNFDTVSGPIDRALGDAFFMMLENAARLGANAVVDFRYESVVSGAGVVAYGTAVWAEQA
jgi:uncharacterized protein YbjQ (UPF0145 family)